MKSGFAILALIVTALLPYPSRVGGNGRNPAPIAEDSREWVVKIVTPQETGTGLMVGQRDNNAYILTAYHVVAGAQDIAVTFFNQRDVEFKKTVILRRYADLDIAVIKVTGDSTNPLPSGISKIRIGAVPKDGDKLSTIGHPADLDWQYDKDTYPFSRLGYENDHRKFLFANPALQRGVSGGPVLDGSSALVGMVSGHNPAGYGVAAYIGFVLPILQSDWGIPTSNVVEPAAKQPNFVVQVYEGSRANPSKGVFVTLKNLITDATEQVQTGPSGLARFTVDGKSLCQVSLVTTRNLKPVTAILAADQVLQLPYSKPVNLAEIRPEDWIARDTTIRWNESIDFAGVESQKTGDLNNLRWPLTILGDKKLADRHLPWGVPKAERILHRSGYVLGYDPEKLIPRWTAYRINLLRSYERQQFAPDPEIPPNEQAEARDYTASGYDRGHLITPREVAGYGMRAATEANYLSTVAPQHPSLNRYSWYRLEAMGRDLSAQGKATWVIAGPIFTSVEGKTSFAVIGQRKVAVPSGFFRIIVTQESEGSVEAQAFIIPNTGLIDREAAPYRVSVDKVEGATGLDFFSNLDKQTQERLEAPLLPVAPIKLPRVGSN